MPNPSDAGEKQVQRFGLAFCSILPRHMSQIAVTEEDILGLEVAGGLALGKAAFARKDVGHLCSGSHSTGVVEGNLHQRRVSGDGPNTVALRYPRFQRPASPSMGSATGTPGFVAGAALPVFPASPFST